MIKSVSSCIVINMKQNKKIMIIPLSMLLIATSCGVNNNTSNSSSTIPSHDGSSISLDDSTSSDSSSSDISEPSTSEPAPVPQDKTISEVKTIASNLKNENSVGVATSQELCRIKGSIIANLTSGTTKSGYGEQYKLLVIDSADTIYVRSNLAMRVKLSYELLTNKIIEFVGYPSLYRKTPELELKEYKITNEYQSDFQNSVATKLTSFADVYNKISKLVPNCKGTSFGELFSISGLCFQKTIASDKNIFFIDNNNSLLVYVNSEFYNQLSVGTTYQLIGAIQMYQFRPSFVLTKIVSTISESTITYDEFSKNGIISNKTAANLYSEKPRTDLQGDSYTTYPNYSSLFGKMYKLEGYANIASASSGSVMTFGDTLKSSDYTSLDIAGKDNALVFNNGSETALKNQSDYNNSKVYPYYSEDKKISINVFPYEYRNGYFKIEGYLDSIQEIV